MPISSVVSNPLLNSSPMVSNASATIDKTKPVVNTPPSTIVTLSAQAQQLNKNQSSGSTSGSTTHASPAAASLQSVPKEANEASGIQLMQGQARGGRISTYA